MRPAIPAVLILACALPASAADPQAGTIRVTATYPGADARTVDETVIRPLFRQINPVEGVTRIESEARNDGTGSVTVYFEPKTNLNLAEVIVQNRANLALPTMPEPCRRLGVSVRKFPAGPPAFWLALTSSDDKHDAKDLGNYAAVYLKPELTYFPGVADVRLVDRGELAVRVWLDLDRLRAYDLNIAEVIDALRQQNAGVAAGSAAGGQAFPFTASGRLTRHDQFADVILRANPDGEVLRVKDVARVELGANFGGFARVNGKPAALIGVTAWPGRVTAARLRNIEAAGELPPGVRFDVVADRAADRLLEVEVRVPPGSSPEHTEAKVTQATAMIHLLPGKLGTVAFSDGREPNTATILVKVPAKGGPTAAAVEKALAAIPDAAIRVGGASPGGEAFPVRIALTYPGELLDKRFSEEAFREVADGVIERLTKDAQVTGVAAYPVPAVPHFAIDVNREQCGRRGVKLADLFMTLQTAGSGVHATDFTLFGRVYRVIVQAKPQSVRQVEDLKNLFVRNERGEMVSLEKLFTIRKAVAPPAVVRVNGYRAVIITAAPAAGQTPAEAAARCVKLAREGLPRGYRATDLTDPSH